MVVKNVFVIPKMYIIVKNKAFIFFKKIFQLKRKAANLLVS